MITHKSFIVRGIVISLAMMVNVPVYSLPSPRTMLEEKMKKLRGRVSMYQKCFKSTCTPQEKQAILKEALKDCGIIVGSLIVLGVIVKGTPVVWKKLSPLKEKSTSIDDRDENKEIIEKPYNEEAIKSDPFMPFLRGVVKAIKERGEFPKFLLGGMWVQIIKNDKDITMTFSPDDKKIDNNIEKNNGLSLWSINGSLEALRSLLEQEGWNIAVYAKTLDQQLYLYHPKGIQKWEWRFDQ